MWPTVLRHSVMGFCSMIGRIGSIAAPMSPLLVKWLLSLFHIHLLCNTLKSIILMVNLFVCRQRMRNSYHIICLAHLRFYQRSASYSCQKLFDKRNYLTQLKTSKNSTNKLIATKGEVDIETIKLKSTLK